MCHALSIPLKAFHPIIWKWKDDITTASLQKTRGHQAGASEKWFRSKNIYVLRSICKVSISLCACEWGFSPAEEQHWRWLADPSHMLVISWLLVGNIWAWWSTFLVRHKPHLQTPEFLVSLSIPLLLPGWSPIAFHSNSGTSSPWFQFLQSSLDLQSLLGCFCCSFPPQPPPARPLSLLHSWHLWRTSGSSLSLQNVTQPPDPMLT